MTISKGQDWGTTVERPANLRTAGSDAELAQMLADGTGLPTSASAGDVFRTVGGRPLAERTNVLALPVDLMRVSIDRGAAVLAVAHVLARGPWRLGGWWRGEVLAVMNAEFVGRFDVAPRGHPNDGRVETFRTGNEMSARQRWEVRRRLRGAQHLPHPLIESRPVRSATWDFDRPSIVIIDGRRVGLARTLHVEVVPDAAILHV